MGMFDWIGKSDDAEDKNILAQTESGGSTSGVRVETSESARVVREAKQKKDKGDDSGKRTFSLADDNAAIIAAEQSKVLDALLDPKVWRGAVAAPGDAMVVLTGKQYWELSDDERDTLAKTGAATARCFAVTNPKWLALTLFSFSVISIYGSRCMKSVLEKKETEKAAALQAPKPPQ